MLWEIEQKFHPRLPKVREKSGASGLLWICRQLKYQNLIFQNILQVPLVHSTAKMAVTAAYTSTYEAYHGFLVKQVFLSSFDAAPSADEILNHMIPSSPVKELVDSSMRNSYVTDESTNCAIDGGHSLVTKPAPPSRNPLELIGSHFLSEWIKFERFLNQCNGIHAESSASRNGLLVPAKNCSVIDFKNVELFVSVSSTDKNPLSKESFSINMVEEEIVSFNGTIQPILSELDLLIDTLGINDPSKC
jgi:Glycolipid transfer protein (GLTP)